MREMSRKKFLIGLVIFGCVLVAVYWFIECTILNLATVPVSNSRVRIDTVEVRGEVHEYLRNEHLPNCSFCSGEIVRCQRTDLLLEGEELHEVFIIDSDSAQITDHCDDCKYCRMKHQEEYGQE